MGSISLRLRNKRKRHRRASSGGANPSPPEGKSAFQGGRDLEAEPGTFAEAPVQHFADNIRCLLKAQKAQTMI